MRIGEKQSIQDEMYRLPYHYIPRLIEGNFTQTQSLRWGYEYLSYLIFLLKLIEGLNFGSVLDVGCGDGRFLNELSKQGRNCRLVGLDPSSRAIAYAKFISPEVLWVEGKLSSESPGSPFDLITLIEVIEHIEPNELDEFLSLVHYNLNSDGRLIISVPSSNIPLNKKHYQHFALPDLQRILSKRFNIDSVHYINKTCFARKVFHLLMENKLFILNNQTALNFLWQWYLDNLLHADASNASRIVVVCSKV